MYIGTIENAPSCVMPEPNQRILRCLISPELDPTQKDIAVGMAEIEPGSNSDYRGHEEGELFYCLEGSGHIKIEDELYELKKDSCVYVPPFMRHQTINDGGEGVFRLLFVLTPPFGGDRSIIEMSKRQNGAL